VEVANKKAVKDGAARNKPRGVGRPPAEIDADDVWHYARSGATAKEIAQVLGVSKRTIDRRFGPLFRKGRDVCATMLSSTERTTYLRIELPWFFTALNYFSRVGLDT